MPTPTYDLIASTTLATATSTVTFGSLPQTYRDLVLVMAGGFNITTDLLVTINSDSGSNYSRVYALGSGSSTLSAATTYAAGNWGVANATLNNNVILQFMDYSATDKHKTVLSRLNNPGSPYVGMMAGRWANTAAITTLALSADGGTLLSETSFALYGIAS